MKAVYFLVGCVLVIVLSSLEGTLGLPTTLRENRDRVSLMDLELEPIYEHGDTNTGTGNDESNAGIRQARVTCDLLSFHSKWLTPNHTACAARCLAQRKKGGTCKNGICHCRR